MKKVIKSIIFLLIFAILFYYIFSILWVDRTWVVYSVYDEEKNSSDIVYIGASTVYSDFNTVLAYDLYGFTTSAFASASQPFPLAQYFIKESQKYQTPKLYVIDLVRLGIDFDDITGGQIRRNTDSMKFSKNRIDAINEMLDYKQIDKDEYINYYFSFFMYHNRWKNITNNNFERPSQIYKGFYFEDKKINTTDNDERDWEKDALELPENINQALMDLINYIKTNNLNVLFIIAPMTSKVYDEKTVGRLKSATSILQENGFNVINFNTLDDFNIDFSKDFYDNAHLSIYGSTKYTLYFSKYLKEHYDLPNHKGDSNYNSWDNEYERFKHSYKERTKEDFDNLITQYSN